LLTAILLISAAWNSSHIPQELEVELLRILDHPVQGEMNLDASPTGSSKADSKALIFQEGARATFNFSGSAVSWIVTGMSGRV
jgi:hypothetical protein